MREKTNPALQMNNLDKTHLGKWASTALAESDIETLGGN